MVFSSRTFLRIPVWKGLAFVPLVEFGFRNEGWFKLQVHRWNNQWGFGLQFALALFGFAVRLELDFDRDRD
jgi:hypothetical protein